MLEALVVENVNPYRLMAEFFDPNVSDRWMNADNRAHKTFVVLAWLEQTGQAVRIGGTKKIGPKPVSRSVQAA